LEHHAHASGAELTLDAILVDDHVAGAERHAHECPDGIAVCPFYSSPVR
jgi:hypothetical protein